MSLDRIEITPFALVAGELLQVRRTGVLTIVRGSERWRFFWAQGELTMAATPRTEDGLAAFLVSRNVLTHHQAAELHAAKPENAAARFHETGVLDHSARQTLLREWLTSLFLPLFSLDEGTAVFADEDALDAELRIFLQSTAALILEGIRSITNGLVLRRSLGDLKRLIECSADSRYGIESLPLTDAERSIAMKLEEPTEVEAFLKQFHPDSVLAAKVIIGMLAIGVFAVTERRPSGSASAAAAVDVQRDLELMAAIGSGDQRSLQAIAFSRQLPSMNHYEVLGVVKAAPKSAVMIAAETLKKKYDPASFPAVLRELLKPVVQRFEEASAVLQDPGRRAAYDRVLEQQGGRGGQAGIQQRLVQRSIALQNFNRAKRLTAEGDHYGAIVLLKQTVNFAPDHADAWFLLGACQERNPKWRREAAESFQKALAVEPNHVGALISLGDLYKSQGLTSRAQTCYEDALKIAPENPQAASRLKAMGNPPH